MSSRLSLIVALFMIAFLFGCSSSTPEPILPEAGDFLISESISEQNRDQTLIFAGTLEIDLETNSVSVYERAENINYNITGFISSACPGGCFRYYILSYVNEVLTIRLEIENPTSLLVYDVRMIFTNLYGKQVLNPDNFTNLFDPPGGMPFSPQIAFAKESDNRNFPVGPGSLDSEILELKFPYGASPLVDFVVVASYPGQCAEPFQIYDKKVEGALYPSGGSCELSAKVKDHQSNVSWVAADTSVFTGGYKIFQYSGTTQTWSATISNDMNASPGEYTVFFAAASYGANGINLYDFFKVTVFEDILSFETPRPIDDYEYAANPDTITQGGKGIKGYGDNVYLIYYITDLVGDQQIDFLKSPDGGDTFLPHIRVNTDDPTSIHLVPAMDVSPNGTIHAVWIRGDQSGFGSNLEYAKSTDNGESFTEDVYVAGFFFELWPDIEVYGNNKIFALRNGAPWGVFHLYMDVSLDGGLTWGDDLNVSQLMWGTSTFNDLFPVMDVDPFGNVYIIFESDSSPEKQSEYSMWLTKSSNDGASFSLPRKVSDLNGRMRLPNIECDSKGGIHCFWVYLDSGTEGDIRYSFSDNGGLSFYPSVEVDDVNYSANEPVVAIDPNDDTLYVAYNADSIRVHRSSDGTDWGESVSLGRTGSGINVYVDNNSRVHISFGSGGKIYYSRSLK